MKYLGIMKQEHGHVTMPDTIHSIELQQDYEVVDLSGDLLLLPVPSISSAPYPDSKIDAAFDC